MYGHFHPVVHVNFAITPRDLVFSANQVFKHVTTAARVDQLISLLTFMSHNNMFRSKIRSLSEFFLLSQVSAKTLHNIFNIVSAILCDFVRF